MKKTVALAAAMAAAQIGATQAAEPAAIISLDAINFELPGFIRFQAKDTTPEIKRGTIIIGEVQKQTEREITICATRLITNDQKEYRPTTGKNCLGKIEPTNGTRVRVDEFPGVPAGEPFKLTIDPEAVTLKDVDLAPVASLKGAMDKAEYAKVMNAAPTIANPCGADAPKSAEMIGVVGFASQPKPKDAGMILLTCGDGSRKGIRLTR